MPRGPRKLVYMLFGAVDYTRDKLQQLQHEMVQRGEDRAEDLKDFWDDIIENISSSAPVQNKSTEEEWETGSEKSGMAGLWTDFDIKGIVADLMDDIGLIKAEDIKEIRERLDRIGRAIDNLT